MSGRSEGFTLIEVLVAISIIAFAFTMLLEILSGASLKYERSREEFKDMVFLDRKLKERDHEGISVSRKKLPDFPSISEVVYSYKGVFFVKYEAN